ncbi:hypothetical protein Hypma_002975 [Hypsizygus marmoreus]|uniref:Uncharacterized protein n=1 Tax=Hypsizygus marmoreus TaxID=39966 RepID=A0A369J3A7_HYPMA|nr:hypothetical protein Hypma_002975 [Hypsizygus marmoreus]
MDTGRLKAVVRTWRATTFGDEAVEGREKAFYSARSPKGTASLEQALSIRSGEWEIGGSWRGRDDMCSFE